MIRAYSIADVRAAEDAAMAQLPEGELMQRAAHGLAEVAAARLEERDGRTVVALVGAGNNGGDALYAAGLLATGGYPCAVVAVSDRGRDGAHAGGLEAAESAGCQVVLAADGQAAAAAVVAGADLVLDGITGIGGRPGLSATAAALVDAIDDDAWVVAVDVASGLDPDGRVAVDDEVWADETVTFGCAKPVHLLPAGESASGRLTLVDIGLDLRRLTPVVERLTWDDVPELWPVPAPSDDKYSRGVLGVVAGGEGYSGAAVLAVSAAAETGVGMIRYVGTPTPAGLVRAEVPEAVHGPGRVQAWLIGPGLEVPGEDSPDAGGPHVDEHSEEQLRVAREALASDLPCVVDAGGLDLVRGRRAAPTLLTPHAGELARLLTRLSDGSGDRKDPAPVGPVPHRRPGEAGVDPVAPPGRWEREEVERDPVGAATRAAELTGATVLLKGSCTVIVSPDDDAAIRAQADAPTWLATAGAGDVLSGILGALVASGLDPLDAGSLGALVHGVAADLASGGGPLRARDVVSGIRPAVRMLLTRSGVTEALAEPS